MGKPLSKPNHIKAVIEKRKETNLKIKIRSSLISCFIIVGPNLLIKYYKLKASNIHVSQINLMSLTLAMQLLIFSKKHFYAHLGKTLPNKI